MKLTFSVSIDERPGIFLPRSSELAAYLKQELICHLGSVQSRRSVRALRDTYVQIVEMVHFESHGEP